MSPINDFDHEAWIRSLKVGDTVCDCRHEHHKIIRIEECTCGGDRNLITDDDYSFSARHCCDPADHEHWFVYLLRCKDNTIYCGITNDIWRRIDQHNKGGSKGSKYTRSRRPVELVNYFRRSTKSEALKLEAKIKKMSKTEKLNFEDDQNDD
jgi:putative endonuclease